MLVYGIVTTYYNWINSERLLELYYHNDAVSGAIVPKNTSQTDDTIVGRRCQAGTHRPLAYLPSIRVLRASDPWQPNSPRIRAHEEHNWMANEGTLSEVV